jgi:hypothetical protein
MLDGFGFSQDDDFYFAGVSEIFFDGSGTLFGELGGFAVVDSV